MSSNEGNVDISPHSVANYKFSSEEIRVLQECNYESFFQRSLPISSACSALVYLAIQRGILKSNAKYGVGPKVFLGAIVGYFLGKISYQRKCAEKIMQLPNSKLAEMLRLGQKSNIINYTTAQNSDSISLSPLRSTGADIQTTETENWNSSSFDLDVESKPIISGLDDSYRPSLDMADPMLDLDSRLYRETSKPVTTYDEIRKRNRDEFVRKLDVRQT